MLSRMSYQTGNENLFGKKKKKLEIVRKKKRLKYILLLCVLFCFVLFCFMLHNMYIILLQVALNYKFAKEKKSNNNNKD